MTDSQSAYYLPEPSYWPIVGSIALFTLIIGASMLLNGSGIGNFVMGFGFAILVYMLVGWFGTVISESEEGLYNSQVDVSFRWAMAWFIFSEVMFFAAFFGALFYARVYSVPWLGGEGAGQATKEFLWPVFEAVWPLIELPDPTNFTPAHEAMGPVPIPAINTAILLSSGATITWAHWGLKSSNRRQLILGLLLTVVLGTIFLSIQMYEYSEAYSHMNLKLTSGIYGTTFFMLTGFHGLHVTLGAIMLTVILLRAIKGHFTSDNHFAFEAVAWYWHFVDVVWICLFIIVYIL
jgi:cytochrome c oxidase subunit 3